MTKDEQLLGLKRNFNATVAEARQTIAALTAERDAALAEVQRLREALNMVWVPTHRHRKGGLYRLIACARHTETYEALAVYDGEDGQSWCRPQEMFADGRFTPLDPDVARALVSPP